MNPLLKDHVSENVQKNMQKINDLLMNWSLVSSLSLKQSKANIFQADVTQKLVLTLLPLLGIDPQRPWAPLDQLLKEVKANEERKLGKSISELQSELSRCQSELRQIKYEAATAGIGKRGFFGKS